MRKVKKRPIYGAVSREVQPYEERHGKVAAKAAAEGIVLLKNEKKILPLPPGKKVALYGSGAVYTVKGGNGSGDVNSRKTKSIYEGLRDAGFVITTQEWIDEYTVLYEQMRQEWRNLIWKKADNCSSGERYPLFQAYSSTPFLFPKGADPWKTDTDTAIFVLSRTAGEGSDRYAEKGDYYISGDEKNFLDKIYALYPQIILVLNTGGLIDLSFVDDYERIQGIVYLSQPGMEAGKALADIISGRVTPSGRLTDSWAMHYKDYPNAETFSHNNGNTDEEFYQEGIFVGYRYFDTFEIPVRYCFGYGLSYTTFDIKMETVSQSRSAAGEPEIVFQFTVKNTGDTYSGREVVQVYAACPQKDTLKEYRRLAGFQKTTLLMPGEMEKINICIPPRALAYFHTTQAAWMLDDGVYGIFAGASLEDSKCVACLHVEEGIKLEVVEHICPQREPLQELRPDAARLSERRQEWKEKMDVLPAISISKEEVSMRRISYDGVPGKVDKEVSDFVETLSEEEMMHLVLGKIGRQSGNSIGAAGSAVSGSAGQTDDSLIERGLASIVLADGPSGLRLNQTYRMKDGEKVPRPEGSSFENGYLCRESHEADSEMEEITYYQYCTAFPVGTLLAQSWDTELLAEVGRAVAEEMQLFGVTLWLAPGMNLHRNPLCGRNFEYYSEDPFLSGKMAAAMTVGVQSQRGCGTALKHFACNNQEDNRMHSDSIVSERALRELYLRGFEIAVKEARPMSIMTSYNRINGVHAANNYDLCTKAARYEWGFRGVIMTDWTTTMNGADCTAAGCIRAGNDLVMPGALSDYENLREERQAGTLKTGDLKKAVCHIVQAIWNSNQYES